MNKIILIIPLALAIFIAGCASSPMAGPEAETTGVQYTVEITSEGFSPSQISINAGDTVVFVNKDSETHWPASAQHPTHKAYPESGGCIGSKFDACKPLAQGESWPFTFSQKGEWKYHDHANCCTDSRFFGSVIVN